MLHSAPQFLQALEQSGLAMAIRSSSWAYPLANVGHILALVLFAGAVAVMDLRLLGAFSATRPADVIRPARRVAAIGLALMAISGFALFAAEASHVAMNTVFQLKLVLIVAGIVNALLVGRVLASAIDATPAQTSLPVNVRASAVLSMAIWLSVAACGRLIAYF